MGERTDRLLEAVYAEGDCRGQCDGRCAIRRAADFFTRRDSRRRRIGAEQQREPLKYLSQAGVAQSAQRPAQARPIDGKQLTHVDYTGTWQLRLALPQPDVPRHRREPEIRRDGRYDSRRDRTAIESVMLHDHRRSTAARLGSLPLESEPVDLSLVYHHRSLSQLMPS